MHLEHISICRTHQVEPTRGVFLTRFKLKANETQDEHPTQVFSQKDSIYLKAYLNPKKKSNSFLLQK